MKLKKQNFFSKLWSENLYCFLAAIIAAVIMIFVYMCYNFFPVGDNIVLRMDLYHQYAPLFAELYDRIFEGQSLIYSFTSGLGSGFLGNYFNYLASPTLLFVLIFGHLNIPEAIAAMILTKASVSAFTFAYFTKKVFKNNNLISTAFGLMYAFGGWFVAYYWNVMWLDAVCIFPIVMLGIYKIITKCKPLTFTLSLAFVLLTNYYMGFMVCVLSVIMFLYFYFSNYEFSDKINPDIILKKQYSHSVAPALFNNRLLKTGCTFALSGIAAAGIAAFALIPLYFTLQRSSATSSSFPQNAESYFSVFDFLANHISGLKPTIRSSGNDVLPNVYCGILTVILAVPYFFTKEIKIREKISTVTVLGLFYFSFNINYLNYVWHGFHFPNDLPYRFSFAYSFFLLLIAFKVISNIDKINLKTILASSFGVVCFTILVQEIGSKNVEDLSVWTTIVFAIIYAVVIAFMKDKKYVKSYISILLLCTVCTEILVSNTSNYSVSQNKKDYVSGYEQIEKCIDKIDEQEGKNSFYRMELASLVRRMDNCWYGYNGSSTFTSMAYEELAHLASKLGLSGNDINSYTYHSQTAVYNSLFGIKYIVDNNDYTNTDNYECNYGTDLFEKQDSFDDATIYKNKYPLPLAYSSSLNALTWEFEDNNPFSVQSNLFKSITGVDNVFEKLDISVLSNSNTTSLTDEDVNNKLFTVIKTNSDDTAEIMLKVAPPKTKNVYVYLKSDDTGTCYVTYNGNLVSVEADEPFIFDCGEIKENDEVYLTIGLPADKSTATVTAYAYSLNLDNFKKGIETINKAGTLDITSYKESYIKGNITVAEDNIIFTTIPYDEGWSVKIDGEDVTADNIYKLAGSLLAVKTTAGEHEIEFSYMPVGLVTGISISLLTLVLLILIYICKARKILVFSDKFKSDNINLGKWRDEVAENTASLLDELDLIETEEIRDSEIDDSPFLAPEERITWNDVLSEAEAWSKKEIEDRKKEQEQLEAIHSIESSMLPHDKSDEYSDSRFIDTESSKENNEEISNISSSEDDSQNIRAMFVNDEKEETSHTNKTNKKLFIIIAIIVALAVILIVGITSLGKKAPSPSESLKTEITTESTTLATTKPTTATTKSTTVPTTAATTVATTAPTTEAKTASTTTEAPIVENGDYQKYVVKSGDYPFSILRNAGLEPNMYLDEFYRINGNKTTFNVGDTVLIPNP